MPPSVLSDIYNKELEQSIFQTIKQYSEASTQRIHKSPMDNRKHMVQIGSNHNSHGNQHMRTFTTFNQQKSASNTQPSPDPKDGLKEASMGDQNATMKTQNLMPQSS